MKRLLSWVLIVVLLLGCLSGCGASTATPEDNLEIVTTIFPIYDWVNHVLGDNPAYAGVGWLLSSGVDMHSFQPGVSDIVNISQCDLFIYVGGESDAWVRDALKQAENPNMIAISLMDVLGDAALEEASVEGMQGDAEDDALDEHVWLSLKNATLFVDRIARELATLDAAHADEYKENAAAYSDKLRALDQQYEQAVSGANRKTLLFADRFPFRYLTEDYGLSYYAAFSGCYAETEASFETVTFLANKVDELGLRTVLTIDGGDHRLADTIIRNTASQDQQILTLDSMQATSSDDHERGAAYLSVMEQNLAVLKQALA